jgi:hypothetical protein
MKALYGLRRAGVSDHGRLDNEPKTGAADAPADLAGQETPP